MRRIVILISSALIACTLFSQVANSPASDRAIREARHRLMLVSTHAAALFASADSIESSLHADGSTLHPQTGAMKLRIQSALSEADAAIKERDLELASTEMRLAEELVTRLARRIGGE
jgi:hypothetical protein